MVYWRRVRVLMLVVFRANIKTDGCVERAPQRVVSYDMGDR